MSVNGYPLLPLSSSTDTLDRAFLLQPLHLGTALARAAQVADVEENQAFDIRLYSQLSLQASQPGDEDIRVTLHEKLLESALMILPGSGCFPTL